MCKLITMLETLQTFCDTSATPIYLLYGEREAFNIDVDSVPPGSVVLYRKGYFEGVSNADQQGAWDDTYTLVLNLLVKSEPGDNPKQRLPRFVDLNELRHKLQRYLSANYTLSPVNFRDGINQTDLNMDGLELSFTAKPKETLSYC